MIFWKILLLIVVVGVLIWSIVDTLTYNEQATQEKMERDMKKIVNDMEEVVRPHIGMKVCVGRSRAEIKDGNVVRLEKAEIAVIVGRRRGEYEQVNYIVKFKDGNAEEFSEDEIYLDYDEELLK